MRFWPDPKFFDSDRFSVPDLKRVLKAKAVLCPGLRVSFHNEQTGEKEEWFYTGDLGAYLVEQLGEAERLPPEPITGKHSSDEDAVEWALAWSSDAEQLIAESYVNLIPTTGGGTHVNGLRAGVVEAVREFCEFRNLLPRGIKLTAEDIWDRACYVLSIKIRDPQFAGQTKEKLGSREAAALVETHARDAAALWLNQHPDAGERIAQFAIENAQERIARGRARGAQARGQRPGAARQARRLQLAGSGALGAVPGRRRLGRRFGQAGARPRVPGHHAAARQDPEHLGARARRDRQLAGSARHRVALGVDPGSSDLTELRYHKVCILADADSDGQHIATLLCALFLRHFRPLVSGGHIYVAMPPLYRIDAGKQVLYALDDEERDAIAQAPDRASTRASNRW